MGSSASLQTNHVLDHSSVLNVGLTRHPLDADKLHHRPSQIAAMHPWLDANFLEKAEYLTLNDWDRQVFVRFVIGEHWKGRVSTSLRRHLANAAKMLKSKSNFGNDDSLTEFVLSWQDLVQFWSAAECRALLLASVLFSFFEFRRDVDFSVVLEQNAPSLPAFIKDLCVEGNDFIKSDFAYDDNGLFIDPEDILSLIASSSSPDELDSMCRSLKWLEYLISSLSDLQIGLKIDAVESTVLALDDHDNYPAPLFSNQAYDEFLSSLSSESKKHLRQKNSSFSDLNATKGYIVLTEKNDDCNNGLTYFIATLAIKSASNISHAGSPLLLKRGQSLQTAQLSEDDCSVQPSPRERFSETLAHRLTVYHKVSGRSNEKISLRLVDFVLFAIGSTFSA